MSTLGQNASQGIMAHDGQKKEAPIKPCCIDASKAFRDFAVTAQNDKLYRCRLMPYGREASGILRAFLELIIIISAIMMISDRYRVQIDYVDQILNGFIVM